jgi:hypothetical protein
MMKNMGNRRRIGAVHESFERSEELPGSSDRSFGLVFAGFFALLTALKWHKRGELSFPLLCLVLLFLLFALLAPRALAPLNRLWTKLGLFLHQVTSPILLGLVFYLVFTPMGILMRLTGRDPMRRKWEKSAPTYWIEAASDPANPGGMRDQF